MKKWAMFLLIIAIAVSMTGCDALQRKFTRKTKKTTKPRIYQLKKYDIKPSPDLYAKHFAYWQTWSSELLQRLGNNHKKDARCIEELLGQLHDMQNILVKEKADEFEKHIVAYERVRDTIMKEELTVNNSSRTRMTLEHEDRVIKNDFCVKKIRNFIKKSFDEDQPAPAPSADSK